MKNYVWALLALLLISPFIGELVTGNTPLERFFLPPLFVMSLLLYGVGAILIRETALRWGKGFGAIMLLGLAYGAIEEGLVTQGFFDPHFYAVVAFGMEDYGRVGSLNVLWALAIMIFHAVFSIAIPVVIVNALFGKDRWLGSTVYYILLAVFAINAFLFNRFLSAFLNSYTPDAGSWLIVCAVIVLLVLMARFLPRSVQNKKAPNSWALFFLGAVLSFLYFLLSQGFHNFLHNALINVIVLALYAFLVWHLLTRYSYTSRNTVALASGCLVPMLVMSTLGGMLVITVPAILLLVFTWFKAKSETAKV